MSRFLLSRICRSSSVFRFLSCCTFFFFFFFFNDTATTEIYPLSLHDALPIWRPRRGSRSMALPAFRIFPWVRIYADRSEEHTSELQSRQYLVCRLLLEKKNKSTKTVRDVPEVGPDPGRGRAGGAGPRAAACGD